MGFPFAAIVGQNFVKQALLIAAVNPRVGGVLVAGEKGTAKSTLGRGLAELLPQAPFVNLPLNATEDMIFGSLDMEFAVANGQKRFSPGLLSRANQGFLYIDDINLLRRELLVGVLDTASSGVNQVERDGISYRQEVRYTLIGTLNPEEGALSASLLDRFGRMPPWIEKKMKKIEWKLSDAFWLMSRIRRRLAGSIKSQPINCLNEFGRPDSWWRMLPFRKR